MDFDFTDPPPDDMLLDLTNCIQLPVVEDFPPFDESKTFQLDPNYWQGTIELPTIQLNVINPCPDVNTDIQSPSTTLAEELSTTKTEHATTIMFQYPSTQNVSFNHHTFKKREPNIKKNDINYLIISDTMDMIKINIDQLLTCLKGKNEFYDMTLPKYFRWLKLELTVENVYRSLYNRTVKLNDDNTSVTSIKPLKPINVECEIFGLPFNKSRAGLPDYIRTGRIFLRQIIKQHSKDSTKFVDEMTHINNMYMLIKNLTIQMKNNKFKESAAERNSVKNYIVPYGQNGYRITIPQPFARRKYDRRIVYRTDSNFNNLTEVEIIDVGPATIKIMDNLENDKTYYYSLDIVKKNKQTFMYYFQLTTL